MCQFNLVFVKNEKNKKTLKNEYYDCFNNTVYNGYSGYAQGICNCNSFVGSMSEYNGNSYYEMLKNSDKYDSDYASFVEYKEIFKKLLENEEYILFGCIFDSPGEFTETKTININNITIEDLAKLEFDEILKIHK